MSKSIEIQHTRNLLKELYAEGVTPWYILSNGQSAGQFAHEYLSIKINRRTRKPK